MKHIVVVTCAISLLLAGCGATPTSVAATARATSTPARTTAPAPAVNTETTPCGPIAAGIAVKTATLTLATGGVVKLALRPDKAPKTVATFTGKANAGFYSGLTFHRVVPGFVVQGGDPKGDGSGGGDQPTELSDLPFCLGALGIARAGDIRVSNDSQFFICIGACRFLDGQYTNFGQVIGGMDVASAIRVGDKIKSISVQ